MQGELASHSSLFWMTVSLWTQGRWENLMSSLRHSPWTTSEVRGFLSGVPPTILLFVLHSDVLEVRLCFLFITLRNVWCRQDSQMRAPFITVPYREDTCRLTSFDASVCRSLSSCRSCCPQLQSHQVTQARKNKGKPVPSHCIFSKNHLDAMVCIYVCSYLCMLTCM